MSAFFVIDRAAMRMGTNTVASYATAIGLVGLATAQNLLTIQILPDISVLTLMLAVLTAAVMGGLQAGRLAACLATASCWYFLQSDRRSATVTGPEIALELSLFLLFAALGVAATAAWRSGHVRRRRPESSRQSDKHLQLALDAAQAGTWERRLDTDEVIMSERLLALRGLPPDTTFSYQSFLSSILPDDRATVDAMIQRTIATGEPLRVEYRIPLPDGSIKWIQSHGELRITEGQCRLFGLAQDITERKLREQELHLWTDAFMYAGVGIAITDPETRTIRWTNRAWAAARGFAVGETSGIQVKDCYPPEDWPRLNEAVAEADRTGHIALEINLVRKDGSVFPAAMDIVSVRDADGRLMYRIVSSRDIADIKQTQAELRHAQKAEVLGAITGGMAHDFNNLLAVITLSLDSVLNQMAANDTLRPLIGDALVAADHGAALTRSLLAFARRQPLRPIVVLVNEVVEQTTRLLSRVLGEDIIVEADLTPQPWRVIADPSQLETSLMNLATNARDAMPAGGELMFRTANRVFTDATVGVDSTSIPPGHYVEITVSDTGSGMSPEVLRKAFDPFFTTKEPGRGTGLGLSSVLGFTRQSGGHVLASSEPGRGTAIRLLLPCMPEDWTIPADTPADDTALPRGRGETVLVVEDNAPLRNTLGARLVNLGYLVLKASSASEALEILEGGRIDLLLSDVVMPGGMTGVDLATVVFEKWPDVRVILTTGFAGIETGFPERFKSVMILHKPFTKRVLARAVAQIFGS